MRTGKRIAAAILAALLLLTLLTAAAVFYAAEGHACTGEDCAVCAVVRTCTSLLGSVGGVCTCAMLGMKAPAGARRTIRPGALRRTETSVTRKECLLN